MTLEPPSASHTAPASDRLAPVTPPVIAPSATPPAWVSQPDRSLIGVLHLINGEYYSGAERVQDLLAKRLPEFGYGVHFGCLKPGQFPTSRTAQAPLHECHMRSRVDFRVVRQLCRLVQDYDLRLIHAHTPRSVMIGNLVAARCRRPLVYHVHSPTAHDSTRSLMNAINAVTERFSMARAHRIIAVSESLAAGIVSQGVDYRLVTVVPNGVPAIDPLPAKSRPQHDWTLGSIALFRPRKGTEVLLNALARLRERGYPVRLRAIGSFESERYRRQLNQLTRQLQLEHHVQWLGFQADINAELERMDLFVLPSLFGEGMPMVVLESLAAGVPIVGTRVEGVPEVIRDGLEGRVVEPGNAEALAEAIVSVIDGQLDWQLLRENAIKRHREHYSDHSMAAGLAHVYDPLIRTGRSTING